MPVSTENVFIPEHRDLSECISSLPKPDCGSEARGDWPQMALFGVLVAALVFIGWRIVRSARSQRVRHVVNRPGDEHPAAPVHDASDTP